MDAKESMIRRLRNIIKGQGMIIREDDLMTTQDKMTQLNILIELSHCLDEIESRPTVNLERRDERDDYRD